MVGVVKTYNIFDFFFWTLCCLYFFDIRILIIRFCIFKLFLQHKYFVIVFTLQIPTHAKTKFFVISVYRLAWFVRFQIV